ncbi:MAG: LuxR C-terminal-related transcriptional regulator [Acidimicrobiales bacterium]
MSENSTPRTTVAIVDDHVMVGEMLAHTISSQSDLQLAGIAPNVGDALVLVERERPDVVLMDFRLPDGSGIDAVTLILERHPETKIVMLSGSGGNDLLAHAIEAGCVGLLGKDRPIGDVLAAIRSAARGELVIRSDEFSSLLSEMRRSPDQKTQLLTARELEVLQLLAQGRSTEKIADELFISINTVRNHVANILNKLNVHSKLEAVAIAAREGLIDMSRAE